MSAYRPYPKYKPSSVEWLGEVPEAWEHLPGRRIFEQRRDPARPTDDQLSATQKYGVIPQALFMEQEDQKVVLALGGIGSFKHVEEDDFVISLRSFQGGIEHSAYSGCVSPAYTVLRSKRQIAARYCAQLLKCRQYIAALQAGTDGIREGKSISYEQFGQIPIPIPPLLEQRQIAAFLDRECGKLDVLQAKQERLIALLKEKRRALISHAVTRGLDPAAKLKTSGIEWLGEVPEHWKIEKLWWHFGAEKGKDSQRLTKEFCIDNPGDFPVYSGQTANEGVMGLIDQYDFDEGERGVLFATTVGAKAMELKHLTSKFSLSQNCMIIRPRHSRFDIRFYLHHFTPLFYFERQMIPDHMQPSFRVDDLLSYRIAIPPLDAQRAIVAHLDEKCGKIDQLKAKAERGIELLKERRSALISAAVTGKIDVREA